MHFFPDELDIYQILVMYTARINDVQVLSVTRNPGSDQTGPAKIRITQVNNPISFLYKYPRKED